MPQWCSPWHADFECREPAAAIGTICEQGFKLTYYPAAARRSQRTDAASSLARCKTFINGAMAVQGVFTVEGNFASSLFLNLSTLYLIILWTIQIDTCSSKSAEEINNARFLNMRSLIPSWSWVHSVAHVNVPNSFPYHLHWRVGS